MLGEVDVRIVFDCNWNRGRSFAYRGNKRDKAVPGVCMTNMGGGQIDDFVFVIEFLLYGLVHEVGHTFGLDDTYVDKQLRPLEVSTGGLAGSVGRQPASIMVTSECFWGQGQIGEDDKNGIIWLYKYLYEGHPENDCFFADYHFVRVPIVGCEPKHPLIFEAKHGCFSTVVNILQSDPTLDINARDSSGFMALHHAVQRLDTEIVKALLAQPALDINARDSSGFTALHHAVQRLDTEMVKALLAKPGIKVNHLNTHKRTPRTTRTRAETEASCKDD